MSQFTGNDHSTDREQAMQLEEKRPVVSVVDADPEYQEFLALNERFQGKTLSRLTRKVDWHVIPVLFLIYMLSYIDKGNVSNAKLFGAEADLGLSAQDWNTALSLLFVTYALGSAPANALVKIYGPERFLPVTFLGCALSIVGAGCCRDRVQWYVLRLLLGLFESGIYCGCVYSLTTWYTPQLLQSRLSYFYLAATSSGGFSGLLAYGIGQLDYTWGFRGWRWIYVIEGSLSVAFAIISFFWVQSPPSGKHRWLTDEEKRYLVVRNHYTYGHDKSGSRDEFTWHDFMSAVKSPHVWMLSFADFSFCVGIYGFSFSLPTIVSNMGFTAARAQALSAPPYFFACFCVIACGHLSDRTKQRALSSMIPSLFCLIGLVICLTTTVYKKLVPLTYIAVMLSAGGFYCLTPGISAWIGLNTAGQAKRAAGIAIGVFATQLGGIIGSNIYLAAEAPRYQTGFGVSIALLFVGNIVTPALYWVYVGKVNKKRDAMSDEAITAEHTVAELTAMGDLSPYYRYER